MSGGRRPIDGPLVLGADLGGTSTRVLVVDATGRRLGYGTGGGGNPTAHPPDRTAAELGRALGAALAGIDPATITGAVVGLAGRDALQEPAARAAFDAAWLDSGLVATPIIVDDVAVAFASATPEPDGTVLVAGTGAIAADIRKHRIGPTADGHGWLLGDDGSGMWLGREAARAALRALEGGNAIGPLCRLVVEATLGPATDPAAVTARELRTALYRGAPVDLAGLAPCVSRASEMEDIEAGRIVEAAAAHLAATLGRVREPGARTPLVLSGGVLAAGSPVRLALARSLVGHGTGPVLQAADGVTGAAWLAARMCWPDRDLARTHDRLLSAG